MIIIEPGKKNYAHLEINAAFISLLEKIESNNIELFGDKTHLTLLAEKLSNRQLRLHEIKVRGFKLKIEYFIFLKDQLIQTITAMNYLINHDKALILSMEPWARIFLLLYLKIRWKWKNIFIVYHGELEFLQETKNLQTLLLFKIPLILCLRLRNKNVKHIVLSAGIKNELNRYGNKSNVISIIHPYLFPSIIDYSEGKNVSFVIGLPGVASEKKGTDKIFQIAKYFEKNKSNIEFLIIGKNDMKESNGYSSIVTFPENHSMLDNKEYDKSMLSVDMVIFLYNKNSYGLTASGAFFDALKYEKPIIAFRNHFFVELWETVGEIGILCSSIAEMCESIAKFADDRKQLQIYKENIKKAKVILMTQYEEIIKVIFE